MPTQLPFIQQKRRSNRTGMTNIEYVVVSSLIVVVLVASIMVVGQSTSETYSQVAGSLNLTSPSPDQRSQISKSDSPDVVTETSNNYGAEYLLIFTAVALAVTGVRYLRSSKQNETKEPIHCPDTAIVLKQQSDALRHILEKRNVIHDRLCENWIRMFQGDADIAPYMSTELVTVRPDMKCQDCLEMLVKNGYRRVMVTNDERHLLGVVSKKDIQSKEGTIVADVMTSSPKIAHPDTSLRVALSLMIAHRVSCIPVVKRGLLVGILSTSDLLVVLQSIVIILSGQAAGTMGGEIRAFGQTTSDKNQGTPSSQEKSTGAKPSKTIPMPFPTLKDDVNAHLDSETASWYQSAILQEKK
ncbi:MAG: CBS domain-containing protein [Planctomycetota bacterium]